MADPYHLITDPDPTLFFSGFQDATNETGFFQTLKRGRIHHFVFLKFLLDIEGSGSVLSIITDPDTEHCKK
jgi:hypothetical protein